MTAERHAQAAAEIAQAVFPSDRRGVRAALSVLQHDVFAQAAEAIRDHPPGVALIATGFPVCDVGETDGPPGARALGNAMATLGWTIVPVACRTTQSAVRAVFDAPYLVETVDADSTKLSMAACTALLDRYNPHLVVAIERPGMTAKGRLVNMHGNDLTSKTAALDGLMQAPLTIAIGDGGNEIGMGSISNFLATQGILNDPCVTPATHLLLASVSNWGAYGLTAMLALLTQTDLLPSASDDAAWINAMRQVGAADGVTGELGASTVDGFPSERTAAVLAHLSDIQHRYAGVQQKATQEP